MFLRHSGQAIFPFPLGQNHPSMNSLFEAASRPLFQSIIGSPAYHQPDGSYVLQPARNSRSEAGYDLVVAGGGRPERPPPSARPDSTPRSC